MSKRKKIEEPEECVDYIRVLPAEILRCLLAYIVLANVILDRRVCKAWRDAIDGWKSRFECLTMGIDPMTCPFHHWVITSPRLAYISTTPDERALLNGIAFYPTSPPYSLHLRRVDITLAAHGASIFLGKLDASMLESVAWTVTLSWDHDVKYFSDVLYRFGSKMSSLVLNVSLHSDQIRDVSDRIAEYLPPSCKVYVSMNPTYRDVDCSSIMTKMLWNDRIKGVELGSVDDSMTALGAVSKPNTSRATALDIHIDSGGAIFGGPKSIDLLKRFSKDAVRSLSLKHLGLTLARGSCYGPIDEIATWMGAFKNLTSVTLRNWMSAKASLPLERLLDAISPTVEELTLIMDTSACDDVSTEGIKIEIRTFSRLKSFRFVSKGSNDTMLMMERLLAKMPALYRVDLNFPNDLSPIVGSLDRIGRISRAYLMIIGGISSPKELHPPEGYRILYLKYGCISLIRDS